MHISKFFFACSPYLSWNSLFFAVYYQRVSLRYGLISCLRARRWASSHRRGWADGTGVRTAQHGQGRSGRCRSVRRPHLTDRFVTEPGWSLLAVPARTWHYGHHAVAPAACDVPCTVTVRYRDTYLSLSTNPLSFLASSSKPQKSLCLYASIAVEGGDEILPYTSHSKKKSLNQVMYSSMVMYIFWRWCKFCPYVL
jgi:hypothetical protein